VLILKNEYRMVILTHPVATEAGYWLHMLMRREIKGKGLEAMEAG